MPKKLLLADDSVTIQRVIELTFADEDVAVTAVGDGRQAIDRLRAERPDIVLADVGMPERDGYDVAAFIRNDPQLAHIPVILLTGAFEPLDEERARKVGCDGVLVKPFEPQMVINRVKELLSNRRPAAAAAPPAAAPVPQQAAPPVRSAEAFAAALDASLEPPPRTTDAAKTNDTLDAYFDRLDAAFANLGGPGGRNKPPVPHEDLSSAIAELHEPPQQRTPAQDPLRSRDPDLAPSPAHQPIPAPAARQPEPALKRQPEPAPARQPEPELARQSDPAPPRQPDPAPMRQPDPGPAPQPDLANAFAALLAAEQGHPAPEVAFAFAPAPGPRLGEDEIEQIVQRVIDRLTDDSVRQTVLDTAERLVREEIDRIKRQARTGGSGPQTGR